MRQWIYDCQFLVYFFWSSPFFSKLTICQSPRVASQKWQKNVPAPSLWYYGLSSFHAGGTKLEIFLPKNQHTQRKLLNFENWVNGEVSKLPKFDQNLTFKVNFLCQKLSESFSNFFSLKNINLRTHFLLLTFFDSINF